jgi:hypothetical protein
MNLRTVSADVKSQGLPYDKSGRMRYAGLSAGWRELLGNLFTATGEMGMPLRHDARWESRTSVLAIFLR